MRKCYCDICGKVTPENELTVFSYKQEFARIGYFENSSYYIDSIEYCQKCDLKIASMNEKIRKHIKQKVNEVRDIIIRDNKDVKNKKSPNNE